MKNGSGIALIVVALAFGLGAALQASGEVSKSIAINRDAKFGDKVLAKGNYTVKFKEDSAGEIVFLKGKNEVLKVSYELGKLDGEAADTLVFYKSDGNGGFKISRIEFKGRNSAVVFH